MNRYAAWEHGLPALWLAALILATAPAWSAELTQRPQGNVTVPGTLHPEADEQPPASAGPDERPLWRLLSAGDYLILERRIDRLRALYPDWQPPARMSALVAHEADERTLARAKAAHDWGRVRQMAAAHPEMASCGRPDDAAVVAAAPGAASSLGAALAACPDDAARIALLGAAFDRFGAEPVGPLLDRMAGAALPPAAQARLDSMRAELRMQRLGRALSAGSPDVLAQGDALRGAIDAKRDAGTAASLGWAALKAGQSRTAVAWFEAARRYELDGNAGQGQADGGLARAYFMAGDTEAARRILAQMPSGAGAGLAAEIELARTDAAFRRGGYAEAATLAAQQSDPPLILGWSLVRLRQFDAAAQAFERRYLRHREKAAAEGLVLSLTEAGRYAEADALAARLGGAVQAAVAIAPTVGGADTGYQFALARLRTALDAHDSATATRMAVALAGPVELRGDSAAAMSLGWAALEDARLDDASRWFALGKKAAGTREDAEYGEALVAFKAGDPETAARAAAAHAGSARWQRLRLDALMLHAQRLAESAPASPEADAEAREVLQADPARRDAALLLAWSAYHAGRHADAASEFEQLYRATPDRAAAIGLVTATDDPARREFLGAELGGPVQTAVSERAARDAFARKDFLAAARADPAVNAALLHFDQPTFGISETYRSKSGGQGTSRLESEATDIFAAFTHGTDRVAIRLHLVSLDAGRAPTSAGAAGMTTRLPLGAEPSVVWERQPTSVPLLSPFVELGSTPLGGQVGPTVQGRAGVAWQGGIVNTRATLYRQSVTESVLSFTGIVDPASGRRFGRVTETGGKAEAYVQVAPRWGLYGQVAAGVRDGVGVRSNDHVQAAASLSYDLRAPGFDHLTIGPSYQLSHFGRDLSGFTPGQGGYYSPSASHVAGLAVRAMTLESRDFMVRASSLVGWQFARSSGAEDGSGARSRPSRQDGFNAMGDVTAGYRLGENWIAGAMLRYQVSPQYNDLYAGLALTYSFGSRAALLSADLPRFDAR